MSEKMPNLTPEGIKIEKITTNTPQDVQKKILTLLQNTEIAVKLDNKLNLNGHGITVAQLNETGFFETLTEDQLRAISSTIGDIRFHAAANDKIFDEHISELAEKIAA